MYRLQDWVEGGITTLNPTYGFKVVNKYLDYVKTG